MSKQIENEILHIAVFKACPLGEKKIQKLRITADQCFDDLPEGTFNNVQKMQEDADKFNNAICKTLPQGTLDRLTILLLDRIKTDRIVSLKLSSGNSGDEKCLPLNNKLLDLNHKNFLFFLMGSFVTSIIWVVMNVLWKLPD